MGFDEDRFTSAVRKEFICSICIGVADDPVQCTNSGEHIFCFGCLFKWYKQSPECPQCKSPAALEPPRFASPGIALKNIKLDRVSAVVRRMVGELEIKCRFVKTGCPTVTPLKTIVEHEKSCGFIYGPAAGQRITGLVRALKDASDKVEANQRDTNALQKRHEEHVKDLQEKVDELTEKCEVKNLIIERLESQVKNLEDGHDDRLVKRRRSGRTNTRRN